MKTRLKQVSISLNSEGVIGVEENLLFSSTADLSRFAKFTDGTVMIAGRKTAQQMINFGARVKQRRPLVVITENGFLEGTTGEDDKWVYYADNLPEALNLAHAIELEFNLNGYTIVGGKRVYDEYFDLVDKGKERPNKAYIFSHNVGATVTDEVKLTRDLAQITTLLNARMVSFSSVWSEADVLGKDFSSTIVRSKNGRFNYLTDKSLFDDSQALKVGTHLRIATDGGEVCVDTYSITGWSHRNDINSIEITLSGGEHVTVRPRTPAGLNSLLCLLNMTAHN